MSDRLQQILDFLDGSAPLDGYWYGEHPVGKPLFWWRKELKPLIAAEVDKARREGYNEGWDDCVKIEEIPLISPHLNTQESEERDV